jgi:hypothetical protein
MGAREEAPMDHFPKQRTVTPILREDGTIYFRNASKPISEWLCEWTLPVLWFLVALVLVGTMLSM